MAALRGQCLCGAVRIAVQGDIWGAGACHCGQCRRQSGHVWASVSAMQADVAISGEVRWYRASDIASRGFCPVCGSFLFWKGDGAPDIGIALGCLDAPTGLRLEKHIFVADKGDYYDIADGLPQEMMEKEP